MTMLLCLFALYFNDSVVPMNKYIFFYVRKCGANKYAYKRLSCTITRGTCKYMFLTGEYNNYNTCN